MFLKGEIYRTTDWFTGGALKFQFEGRDTEGKGVFTVEDFEIDGQHTRTETYDILKDENREYIKITSYHDHEHRLYAEEEYE